MHAKLQNRKAAGRVSPPIVPVTCILLDLQRSEARPGHLLTGSPGAPDIYQKWPFGYVPVAHLLCDWGPALQTSGTKVSAEMFTASERIARAERRPMGCLLAYAQRGVLLTGTCEDQCVVPGAVSRDPRGIPFVIHGTRSSKLYH